MATSVWLFKPRSLERGHTGANASAFTGNVAIPPGAHNVRLNRAFHTTTRTVGKKFVMLSFFVSDCSHTNKTFFSSLRSWGDVSRARRA